MKLRAMSDAKLIELLQLGRRSDQDIFLLARKEAVRRDIGLEVDEPNIVESSSQRGKDDFAQLAKWNWGAFIIAPVWTVANRLELWTLLLFIPLVNVFAIFYLGHNGNRMAYRKSTLSIPDFMKLQRYWSNWAVRFFWISSGVSVLISIILY